MIQTVRKSWRLLSARQKTGLTFLALARVLANFLDLLGIALIGAVGALALGSGSGSTLPIVGTLDLDPQEWIVPLLGFAGAVFILKTAIGVALFRNTALYLANIETRFSKNVAESIFDENVPHLRRQSRPEIEWAILRSTNSAFSQILGSALSFAAEATLALLIFGFLFYADWQLAIAVTLYFGIILALFQVFSQNVLSSSGAALANGSIMVHDSIANLITAFKEITVLSKISVYLSTLDEARGEVARAEATNVYLGGVPRLIVELGLIIGAIAFVAFQYLLGDGVSSLPVIGVFLIASLRMMSALLPLQRAFQVMRYEKLKAESAQEFLWETLQNRHPHRKGTPSHTIASSNEMPVVSDNKGIEVTCQEVRFEYTDLDAPTRVLDGISLTIESGSTVAVIGPSGAGKSTFVDLILGLLDPDSGIIKCDGIDPKSFRTNNPGSIGYVPQKPGLVTGTIEQNIALGVSPEDIDRDALWAAIEGASLTDFVNSLPEKTQSTLGKHADSLSGGQIQRIGLARALYTKPRLLVLDEATSALDAETEAAISQGLELLKGETTLVVVAHRLSTVQKADVVHVLDQGKLVASGTFQQLRKQDSLVKKYVELMSFGE